MNPDQRDAVADTARYLREVRPIDPEEIYEYVEGNAHPAVVRQVLRERAVELGLVERDDGTFVPVEEGPVSVAFGGVRKLPDERAWALEDLLIDSYGPGWDEGETGATLREDIRRLKEDYFRGNSVEYDRDTALGYAIYHLPDNYAVGAYVFAELAQGGLLPKQLRVLDVGAGVGGPALGLHDLLPDDTLVEYDAVEPSAAADVFESLLSDTRAGFQATVHRALAEDFEPEGEYDVILFANVLSELEDPEAVMDRYLDALAPDGTFLGVAPADKNTAIGLRELERAFDDEYTVWGPTVRLWPGKDPSDRGWSFDVKPDLEPPGFQKRLDESGGATGEFVNTDVQFAWFALREDEKTRVQVRGDRSRIVPFAESEEHVTDRLNVLALKLSHDLSEREGANPVFKVSDGSESVGHFAVLTRESALNRALLDAEYGDPLYVENVLLLWNDDQGAYNLVVDGETVVDAIQ
ncbi:small ribosomal subunit Rsm22 family protein [Natronomonas sp. EA1]|uniref:small ribosomal subunit Rsm22 family protein n=1 Tax=Natronomonas sp. EA1 TaxID=3421655 RepID=UPI003EB7D1EB